MSVKLNTNDSISRSTQSIHTIEIFVEPFASHQIDDADEIRITVNGHVVKRMAKWSAERMGLVIPSSDY